MIKSIRAYKHTSYYSCKVKTFLLFRNVEGCQQSLLWFSIVNFGSILLYLLKQ